MTHQSTYSGDASLGAVAAPPLRFQIDDAVTLRPGRSNDAAACGRICYEAFRDIAARHNFSEDFPNAAAASELFAFALAQPETHVVVAESEGRVVGSNMAWEQTEITGVGPITVDPGVQNAGVGRDLMEYVIERAKRSDRLGVRLVQAAYHNRSLALYSRLGFRAREPLSVIQGPPIVTGMAGAVVRPCKTDDIEACVRLHQRLHGFSRAGDLALAVVNGTAKVVERNGKIAGYATDIGFFGHTVGETNKDVMALLASAGSFSGPGFLAPTRNYALIRYCLEHGLRIVQPMTLMSMGYYRKPKGAYLSSILF